MSYFFIPLHFEKLERKDVMCEAARIANAKIAPLIAENEKLTSDNQSFRNAMANDARQSCADRTEWGKCAAELAALKAEREKAPEIFGVPECEFLKGVWTSLIDEDCTHSARLVDIKELSDKPSQ